MKEKLTVLSYGIKYDKEKMRWITIDATKYDEQNNEPNKWAIKDGSFVMSKLTGEFDYEPRPSSRDEEFFKEFRFDTPEEAFETWKKFNP